MTFTKFTYERTEMSLHGAELVIISEFSAVKLRFETHHKPGYGFIPVLTDKGLHLTKEAKRCDMPFVQHTSLIEKLHEMEVGDHLPPNLRSPVIQVLHAIATAHRPRRNYQIPEHEMRPWANFDPR